MSGSKHVEYLLDNRLIRPSQSPILDTLYAIGGIDANIDKVKKDLDLLNNGQSRGQKQSGTSVDEQQERILLSKRNGKLFAEVLEIPELETELSRAVWQVEKSLSAAEELIEEKSEIESATKSPGTVPKT